MDDIDTDKDTTDEPWFGPKRYGLGIRPQSWQAWLLLALSVVAETVVVSVFPTLYPSWFAVKQIGVGFTPATWQGWVVTLLPPLIIIACIRYLYSRQDKR